MIEIISSNILEFKTDKKYHAIISDPPYGLAFMGKGWDSFKTPLQYQQWVTEWSSHLMQFLYPGAICAFFGGTRTYHRLASGLEDSGYEIFDSMIWCYGSGFPKSYNISKGIDSKGGINYSWFGDYIKKIRIERGLKQSDLSKHFPSKTGNLTGCVANWEIGYNIPTPEQFNKLVEILDLPFDNIQQLEREIIETRFDSGKREITILNNKPKNYDITKPNSNLATTWNGYGTALKPAYEPIVLCRKPLEKGGYVNSALKYGTSGLNIDGGRIEYNGKVETTNRISEKSDNTMMGLFKENGKYRTPQSNGRFPANFGLICDCEQEPCECVQQELDNQSGVSKSPNSYIRNSDGYNVNSYGKNMGEKSGTNSLNFGDKGGASRFFYTAKASSKERELGLEGLESVKVNDGRNIPPDNAFQRGQTLRLNSHPTVKPIKLIEYLATLLLPPIENSNLLIPFSGVGSEIIGANLAGWNHITGIEIDENYVNIANKRLEHWTQYDNYDDALKSRKLTIDKQLELL